MSRFEWKIRYRSSNATKMCISTFLCLQIHEFKMILTIFSNFSRSLKSKLITFWCIPKIMFILNAQNMQVFCRISFRFFIFFKSKECLKTQCQSGHVNQFQIHNCQWKIVILEQSIVLCNYMNMKATIQFQCTRIETSGDFIVSPIRISKIRTRLSKHS